MHIVRPSFEGRGGGALFYIVTRSVVVLFLVGIRDFLTASVV
jgi:hypothetical protein